MTAPTVFNLGTLISHVGAASPNAIVTVEGTYGKSPSYPHSYRGYHEDLAFEPSADNLTASEFLVLIGSALGPMPTYKGGESTVNMRTTVWIAEHSRLGARIIDTHYDDEENILSLIVDEEE